MKCAVLIGLVFAQISLYSLVLAVPCIHYEKTDNTTASLCCKDLQEYPYVCGCSPLYHPRLGQPCGPCEVRLVHADIQLLPPSFQLGALDCAGQIRVLTLSHSKHLPSLPSALFQNVPNLTHAFIHNMQGLHALPKLFDPQQQQLQVLQITYNHNITALPRALLVGMRNMSAVGLYKNAIEPRLKYECCGEDTVCSNVAPSCDALVRSLPA